VLVIVKFKFAVWDDPVDEEAVTLTVLVPEGVTGLLP
jgi:hypothetical protein